MAIILQNRLFSWQQIEELGDLERLRLTLDYLPDEELMQALEKERGRGRDDYPVRAVWNSILAGIVFGHDSLESLRRELRRNGQLRALCGFDPLKGEAGVPPAWVYSRFLKKLSAHSKMIDNMFDCLVRELSQALPGFGRVLACDSKAVDSHARPRRKDGATTSEDGRRENDADIGVKTSRQKRSDGNVLEKVKSWFGFKIHLIVDAGHDLPLAYEVTKASVSDVNGGKKLLGQVAERHPQLLKRAQLYLADKAYDDKKLISDLWDEHGIKPLIDIRNMWKDGEETRLVEGHSNVVYDYRGTVYCYCPETAERRRMAFGGFEKDRESLKYRCPARHYGLACRGLGKCPAASSVRIPLFEERRIFTPLARSSYAWSREYRKRSSVERVNSRLDVSFGFERHFIRGLKKMRLRVGLALCVMLSMAAGRLKENQGERLRSLVLPVAA